VTRISAPLLGALAVSPSAPDALRWLINTGYGVAVGDGVLVGDGEGVGVADFVADDDAAGSSGVVGDLRGLAKRCGSTSAFATLNPATVEAIGAS